MAFLAFSGEHLQDGLGISLPKVLGGKVQYVLEDISPEESCLNFGAYLGMTEEQISGVVERNEESVVKKSEVGKVGPPKAFCFSHHPLLRSTPFSRNGKS